MDKGKIISRNIWANLISQMTIPDLLMFYETSMAQGLYMTPQMTICDLSMKPLAFKWGYWHH